MCRKVVLPMNSISLKGLFQNTYYKKRALGLMGLRTTRLDGHHCKTRAGLLIQKKAEKGM